MNAYSVLYTGILLFCTGLVSLFFYVSWAYPRRSHRHHHRWLMPVSGGMILVGIVVCGFWLVYHVRGLPSPSY